MNAVPEKGLTRSSCVRHQRRSALIRWTNWSRFCRCHVCYKRHVFLWVWRPLRSVDSWPLVDVESPGDVAGVGLRCAGAAIRLDLRDHLSSFVSTNRTTHPRRSGAKSGASGQPRLQSPGEGRWERLQHTLAWLIL